VNAKPRREGIRPTEEQALLLRAALLPGNAALDAWRAWKASVDLDRIDHGSRRLLPLLYRNMRDQGVEEPLMEELKGVYRLVWYRNRMLFRSVTELLRALHNAGIETMLLKGAALTLLHYRDYGLRPMTDFDVLVPAEQASATIDLLVARGWSPWRKPPEAFTEGRLSVTKGRAFRDAAGRGVDLHWHVLPECCYPGADDDFWDGAVATDVNGVPTRALNPSDQLLHVCVHGARWNPVPPFRWVADAMMIVRSSESDLDWHRLAAQAEERGLVVPLRHALDYLRAALDASVPHAVVRRMHNAPTTRLEHIEYRARARPARLEGPLRALWLHYLSHARLARHGGLGRGLLGFLSYLRFRWGVDRSWQVPFYAVPKALRRVWGMAAARLHSGGRLWKGMVRARPGNQRRRQRSGWGADPRNEADQ
jgi:hypothetical protein